MDQINYNEQTGQYGFFSAFKPAWHKKGQIISHYPTSAEAIKYAGLDYQVEKRPLYAPDKHNFLKLQEGQGLIETDLDGGIAISKRATGYYATFRTDTDQYLGTVGKKYNPVQNLASFGVFDSIVGGDGIQFETAGALGNGERVFITAKLPGYIEVGKDLIGKYIFAATGHDGLFSFFIGFTPTRIVCANTLAAAMKDCTNLIRIRHTENAEKKLAEVASIIGQSNKFHELIGEIFNDWSKTTVRDVEAKKIIQQVMIPNNDVRAKIKAGKIDELSTQFLNTCDKVFEFTQGHSTQQANETRGTVYGLYNGITGYYEHVAKYKNDDEKIKSTLMGGMAEIRRQRAFNLCLEFQQKGSFILN